MDINDLHPPDDHANRYFIWHEWIQANGPLNEQNVLDYFSCSMYYDKQSTNQQLRMQTVFTGQVLTNEAEQLKRFVGIEFAVVRAEPPTFFIINKRQRTSQTETTDLATYFIMNNRIYQAPDLYSLLSNRLLTSVSALQTSLDILRKHRPDYTPRTGFVWPIVGEPETPSTDAKKAGRLDKGKSRAVTEEPSSQAMDIDPSTSQATGTQPDETKNPDAAASSQAVQQVASLSGQKIQNTMLLMNAMRMAAMQSKITLSPAAAALAAAEVAGDGTGAGGLAGVEGSASVSVTVDTPTTAGGAMRSSATPAPGSQEAMIKGVNPAGPLQDSAKTKKKKKRTSVVVPTPSAS